MSEPSEQQALPFEPEGATPAAPAGPAGGRSGPRAAEDAVPYALTARARRSVAPASLPDLEVVPTPHTDVPEEDRFDPRPARARALRRAGRSVAAVARELAVGDEIAASWCREVAERRRRGSRAAASREVEVTEPQLRPVPSPDPAWLAASERAHAAAAAALAGTSEELRAALLVAGLAEVGLRSVLLSTDRVEVARGALGWLSTVAGASSDRVRVRVHAGPEVARDVIVHRWAAALGLSADRLAHAPWPAAPRPDAVRVTIRVADPEVAAVVAGWRDALFGADGDVPAAPEGEAAAPAGAAGTSRADA